MSNVAAFTPIVHDVARFVFVVNRRDMPSTSAAVD